VTVVVLLLSLLAIPGLMCLALLLEWLERVFAQQELALEIRRLLDNEEEIDQLERRIAQAAEPLVNRFS
jgi:hypothetical protein